MFPGSAHSRVFRSFQGWTALTSAGAGEGSLMLFPNVKWTIAYLLLRPFFQPPESGDDIMDASKWAFDFTSPWFPGTFRADSQLLSPTSHPHLRLRECMVAIPNMNPGDTVWWHADSTFLFLSNLCLLTLIPIHREAFLAFHFAIQLVPWLCRCRC